MRNTRAEKASFYTEQSHGNVSDGELLSHGDVTYDFRKAVPGDIVRVLTDQGMHELTKRQSAQIGVDDEGEPVAYTTRAIGGWVYEGQAVELTVSDPNSNGTAHITSRDVLRAGDEFGVSYVDLSTSRNLGRVAGYADMLSAEYEKFVGV